MRSVSERIISDFDNGIKKYYNPEDAERGYINTTGRDGRIADYPVISISLGCVDLSGGKFSGYIEVSDACSEAKKIAKQTDGSSLFIERRGIPKTL